MLFKELRKIIYKQADDLEMSAGLSGARDDGGAGHLKGKLEKFKEEMAIERDLRPSTWDMIEDIEVGNPKRFKQEIIQYHTDTFITRLTFN